MLQRQYFLHLILKIKVCRVRSELIWPYFISVKFSFLNVVLTCNRNLVVKALLQKLNLIIARHLSHS